LDERIENPDFAPTPDYPDLAALLKAAAAGDERAWRAIIDLYARRVYALARSRMGGRGGRSAGTRGASGSGSSNHSHSKIGGWSQGNDIAEEVTQSVFVTVAAKLTKGEYTEQGRFEPWLFRVAMNRIRDEVRRLRRHAEPTDPEVFRSMPSAEADPAGTSEEAGAADSLDRLRGAISQLSDSDREIIELRHHAGMSFKQMADLLSEPLGTLLARHHRALRKLKELMTSPLHGSLEPAGE
jgi:RNA polymerase sigma-70 factor (ECF subfamily)